MIKGILTRLPTMIQGLMQGYIPRDLGKSMLTMPASFLIDESGVIQTAYYGKDEGDHIPFAEIELFFRKSL